MVEIIRWTCFVMVIGLAVVIGSIISASAEDRVILSIKSPYDGETVHSNKITVSGTATAKGVQYIESVTVNGNPADGKDKWSADILLKEGNNSIEVVATTDTGQYNSITITVNYQPTPPPTQPPSYDGAPSEIPTPRPTPTGSISITSTPPGAEVYLDGSLKGITNITLENVTFGLHEIKVTKKGFQDRTKDKYVRAGRTEELDFVLKPLTGSIFVFSTPPGASVCFDNVYKNDTNCTLSEVAEGPHTINLTKSGYYDETRNKYVSADEPTSLHVTLRRCASINISSNPPGANLSLDGNDTGETTPENISKVAQGNRIIKLTKFGYSNNETKVDVSVAKTYHVHVNLSGGYGYIDIDSDPDGASVYLDGKYTRKKTPTNISKVIGNYSIRLRKLEYEDETQDIQVSAGKTIFVTEGLSPALWKRITGPLTLIALIASVFIAIIESIYIILERKKRRGN